MLATRIAVTVLVVNLCNLVLDELLGRMLTLILIRGELEKVVMILLLVTISEQIDVVQLIGLPFFDLAPVSFHFQIYLAGNYVLRFIWLGLPLSCIKSN